MNRTLAFDLLVDRTLRTPERRSGSCDGLPKDELDVLRWHRPSDLEPRWAVCGYRPGKGCRHHILAARPRVDRMLRGMRPSHVRTRSNRACAAWLRGH